MAIERTLILVKPDGVKRGLVGEIIKRFENKGLQLRGLKMLQFTDELAEKHYAEHVGKGFFPELKAFITSGPVVAIALEGDEAVGLCRTMMGATKFTDAAPGTIRGDYAFSFTENLVHGSDSAESAKREIGIFFGEGDLMEG